MIQKEVAERMMQSQIVRNMDHFQLLVQYYCDTKIIRKVPPTCFMPRPKVESIVIRLDRLEEPRVKVKDEELLFEIVRTFF